jgi:rhamnulokinase/L-fuculokinase
MKRFNYMGFDLGASSGRAVLGEIRDRRIQLREVHRFINQPVEIGKTLYWNFPYLWSEILEGLHKCGDIGLKQLDGIAINTWGVDFGLLDRNGCLLGNPVHYRDIRTEGIDLKLLRRMNIKEIYAETGLPAIRISTLSQLAAMKQSASKDIFEIAEKFLMMPDLFRYFLCGDASCEQTAAGSSQLLNIHTGKWSSKIFKTFDLPIKMMPRLIRPSTITGPLAQRIVILTGLKPAPVIAVAGHDTASAVVALPAAGKDALFLSVGTWSALGVVAQEPVISEEACRKGFINEFGHEGILFVKNMAGLYLVENLRRELMRGGENLTYSEMVEAASLASPFKFSFDINSPVFFSTENRVKKNSREFLRMTKQKGMPNHAELTRSFLEALVFTYRESAGELQKLTGRTYNRICLIGGGSKNKLLCQFTADATGLEVVAGPAEATVIGNIALQALAAGQLKHAADIRELVVRSFKPAIYKPQNTDAWDRQFDKYIHIKSKKLQKNNLNEN